MQKNSKTQLNQSLIDGIATLQELALSPEPIGCRELARRLDMEPTRVNRLLQTLDYIGIAHKTPKRKYTSGSGMHVLSAQSMFASGLLQNAISSLETLKKFNQTVALGMLWRDHVSYLFHCLPGMSSTEALGRIGVFPATKGGVGMALLAQWSDEEISNLYENKELEGYDSVEALLQVIQQIREKGFAYIKTNDIDYTIAIAVGKPAFCAIGISGNLSSSSVDEIVQALHEVAQKIENEC